MQMLSTVVRRDVQRRAYGSMSAANRMHVTRGIRTGLILGCGLALSVTLGCLSPTIQSETVDVVRNPDLVKDCLLKSDGTYSAIGEKNTMTLARNAVVQNGGNVLLLLSVYSYSFALFADLTMG
jgi:hypothetical protein